ncbi:hypothetical protein [Chelatococcus asaccharovorans]|uniref:hypothetical protein n=1 Tax=Chelatococcus asaccharovorans TaxID=28210 RepID=UPI00224C6461|nr:hypothetical protein [Chelatococcus asaccharovorans]CAH1660988.1 conserved hypothetical protein [Chelatococcus asaccharovorans]CAH1690103.1 conserved hypothetical protein [Chelatococcus asaccharovorans]
MTDLTAIDILIEPDATALERGADENARLRAQYPAGFALDAGHRPHITLLQRYVRSAKLETVFAGIEQVIRSHGTGRLSFRATALRHMSVAALPGLGLAAIVVTPGPEVLDLQAALIEAIRPCTAAGGTAAAFEITPGEPEINADTLAYVEHYVPDHSGRNFVAHLTVGLAPLDFLAKAETESFNEFTFQPSAIAVFQLGNNGTARKELKIWQAA